MTAYNDREGALADATAAFQAADTAHTDACAHLVSLYAQLTAARDQVDRTEAALCSVANDVIQATYATATMADVTRDSGSA